MKHIDISPMAVDNQLFECQRVANRLPKDDRQNMYGMWAVQTLSYYIMTERATTDWLKAFVQCNPAALMRVAVKHHGNGYDCIHAVNRYLHRYYGLDI